MHVCAPCWDGERTSLRTNVRDWAQSLLREQSVQEDLIVFALSLLLSLLLLLLGTHHIVLNLRFLKFVIVQFVIVYQLLCLVIYNTKDARTQRSCSAIVPIYLCSCPQQQGDLLYVCVHVE